MLFLYLCSVIKLDKHIEILLLDNDCVIVPGFGGFVSHRIEAQWDESDNMFLPPRRTLGFNNQLTLNDSLLVQSYVEAYDMSYPEAQKEIEAEVVNLRHEIDFNGFYDMHGLGTMRRNSEGKYTFSPNECGILTPQIYGLSGIEIGLLPENRHVKADEHESAPTPKAISIRLSTLRKVAAACILAFVLWLLPSPILDKSPVTLKGGFNTDLLYKIMPKSMTTGMPDMKMSKSHMSTPQHQEKADKPTEQVNNTSAPDNAQEKNAPIEDKTHGTAKQANAQEAKWTIVLACMLPQANATQHMNTLSQQGVEGVYVKLSGKNSKVLCGRYDSREEAVAALRRLQEKKPGMAGWITNKD